MDDKEPLDGKDLRLKQVVTILGRSKGPVLGIRIVGKMRVEDYHELPRSSWRRSNATFSGQNNPRGYKSDTRRRRHRMLLLSCFRGRS